jgi:undecaprenyl-diphosphatase
VTITYPEAIVVGLLQGVSELFPVSSLGHSILLPALIGGRWATDLNVSAPESPYLAFIVGLHVATAAALIVYFWRDWLRIISGFVSSIRHRRVESAEERLAWMIIVATIPVGIAGLLLEHTFRTVLGRPAPAAVFLVINGMILYGAERLRRRAGDEPDQRRRRPIAVGTDERGTVYSSSTYADRRDAGLVTADAGHSGANPGPGLDGVVGGGGDDGGREPVPAMSFGDATEPAATGDESNARIARRRIAETTLIGSAQVLALLPGISRSGVTMAAGLRRGLSHEDAARFSFLLATPVILAAGALKLPDLTGPMGNGIGGQVLLGSVASAVGAYAAVRWLTRYFQTRTLTPFAIYCVVAGLASLVYLAIR